MFSLWLKLLLPSAIFGRSVNLHNFCESYNKFVFCLRSHTSASRIGAQFIFQIVEAEKDASGGDESDKRLAALEALDQATDPFGRPGPYAPGE